jgi:signal peptidase I
MKHKFSIDSLKKSGFEPISKSNDFTVLKSSSGVITLYNDGNAEGIINNSLNESVLNEGLLRHAVEMIVIIGLGITYFTTDITIVNGKSMEPTYSNFQVIVKTKTPKKVSQTLVQKNSIVKFKSPEGDVAIKRIVAGPNDEIEYRGASVFINGKFVAENLVWAKQRQDIALKRKGDTLKTLYEPFSFKLKSNEYYVIGDNRDNSIDSRNYGPIESDNIISIVKK